MTLRSLAMTLSAAAVLAAAPLTASASDLPPAVKARQGQMQLYAFNLGQLGAMAKGEVEYDAAAATAAAQNIAALTKLDASKMWPAGTDSDSLEGSAALPDLWQNFEDVIAKAQANSAAADAMVVAAGTDLASLQAAMGGLGGACGGCHKPYRKSE